MKKLYKLILLLIITLVPIKIAAETIPSDTPYGTYEDAQKMIKEAIIDYYLRGPSIQYNYPRASWYLPEEATSQDMHYLVCGTFVYQAYSLAFGASNFPKYQSSVESKANTYYQNNDPSLIYYYGDNNNIYYPNGNTSGEMTVSNFAQYILPGDIFNYDGHVMLAYDKIKKSDGTWDVLMIHSHQENANQGLSGDDIKNYIKVRTGNSAATAKLSYNTFTNITGANSYLDLDIDDTKEEKKFLEGSVQAFWLSNQKMFVNKDTKKMQCATDYRPCSVIRMFTNDNNNAKFNFDIDTDKYNKTKDIRVYYPGLYIEKTVDKDDNNSVYLGDVLTYTIKIKNKSKVNYNSNFYIKETINTELVEFAENYSNINNNTITFTGTKLNSGSEISFTYKVKIKYNIDNINQTIKSTGEFLKNTNDTLNISTGTIENTIVPKVNSNKQLKDYSTCYEEKKDNYDGLNLINEIYKCAWNTDLEINSFNINNLFQEINISSRSTSTILLKWASGDISTKYQKMLLNNYYNVFKHANDYYHHLHWAESGSKTSVQQRRQKEIDPLDFKLGDILIYHSQGSTNNTENGLYAYIYIRENNNNRFTGINYSSTTSERNLFTSNYYTSESGGSNLNNLYGGNTKLDSNIKSNVLEYTNYQTLFDKDYYIILRPELIMEDKYYYYDTSKTYRQIEPQTISNIIDRIDTPSILVYDINNNLINNYNNNIGTGTKLEFTDGETYVSVIGDIDGNGNSNQNDAEEAFKYLRNQKTYANNNIKEAVVESIDTVKDSNIKINDIAKLYQYTKGKINSLE